MRKKFILISIIVFILFSLNSLALLEKLKAYYTFNSDCETDDFSYQYNLTNNGGITSNGFVNNGCEVNSTIGSYIIANTLVSDNPFGINGRNITITTWFKRTLPNEKLYVFEFRNPDLTRFIRIENGFGIDSGIYGLEAQVGATLSIVRTLPIYNNTDWIFLVSTLQDNYGVKEFYINTTNNGSDFQNIDLNQIQTYGILGGRRSGTGYLPFTNAVYDEFAFWNESLTQEEINGLYNNYLLGISPLDIISPQLILTSNISNIISNKQYYNFWFNGISSNNTNIYNCSFYFNDTLKYSDNNLNLDNIYNWSIPIGNKQEHILLNLTCLNENATDENIGYAYFDNIIPNIITDFVNNTIYYDDEIINYYFEFNKTKEFNHIIYDELLGIEYFKFTDNIQIDLYKYNFSVSATTLGIGNYTIYINTTDYYNNSLIEIYNFIIIPTPSLSELYLKDINQSNYNISLNLGFVYPLINNLNDISISIEEGFNMLWIIIFSLTFIIIGFVSKVYSISAISGIGFGLIAINQFNKLALDYTSEYYQLSAWSFSFLAICSFIIFPLLHLIIVQREKKQTKEQKSFYPDY